jgi:hypothetical protein
MITRHPTAMPEVVEMQPSDAPPREDQSTQDTHRPIENDEK